MESTVVETKYGKVKGVQVGNVYIWKSIPYALPPVGDLRFQQAKPPLPWSGVRPADHFGPAAYQVKRPNFEGEISEDCLSLNIWSPAADDRRRPVMVWIHGGGFNFGSGSSDMFDGTSFATQGDVVVVTINYRLGPFGFLHLAEFGGEEFAASGNLGLLDQVAALRWIKENIEAFGGDPSRITIFGESAGGRSVGLLLAMPAAKGLFHRAIIQSGAMTTFSESADATRVAEKVLHYLDVGPNELHKLKPIPAERFLDAVKDLKLGITLAPIIDGDVIPQHPLDQLETGFSSQIPVIIGTNRDECRFNLVFEPIWKELDDHGIVQRISHMVGDYWPEISPYYMKEQKTNETVIDQLIPAMTFNGFAYAALQLSEIRAKQNAATWLYRFDWESPQFEGKLKAGHAVEIPFVWNTLHSKRALYLTGHSPERNKVADVMHKAWTAFAHHGDPNALDVPKWSPYNVTDKPTMLFDIHSRMENDPYRSERIVWEKATEKLKIKHRPTLMV